MTDTRDWQPIEAAPDGVPVETKIENDRGIRNEQLLVKRGNLWWFVDGSMYVYYRPTHWRRNDAAVQEALERAIAEKTAEIRQLESLKRRKR